MPVSNPSLTHLTAVRLAAIRMFTPVALTVTLASAAHAELVIHTPTTVTSSQAIAMNTASSPITTPITTPTDASISRLMQVMQVDKLIEDIITQQQQMATAVQNLPKQLPATQSKSILSRKAQQQLQKVLTKYSDVLGQQIDPETRRTALRVAYQNAAKQHYTQAQVDALIQFYETPMGQQILQQQSQVSMDFLKAALPAMTGNPAELERALPVFGQEIEKIFE